MRRCCQGFQIGGQHARCFKIAGLDQAAALAFGEIAKGGVGTRRADHRFTGHTGSAQGQSDQAVSAGVYQQRFQRNTLLSTQALAHAQRFGIAVAVNVFGKGIAKVIAQGAVGHIQAFV